MLCVHVATELNLADFFTKILDEDTFLRHRDTMMRTLKSRLQEPSIRTLLGFVGARNQPIFLIFIGPGQNHSLFAEIYCKK